jgi:hypothetical protein
MLNVLKFLYHQICRAFTPIKIQFKQITLVFNLTQNLLCFGNGWWIEPIGTLSCSIKYIDVGGNFNNIDPINNETKSEKGKLDQDFTRTSLILKAISITFILKQYLKMVGPMTIPKLNVSTTCYVILANIILSYKLLIFH